jgi:hypothetical protein
MNQKHEKKLRKQMRKASNKWAASKGGKTAWKIARMRDIIFLIACGEGVVIIGLIIFIIWSVL